MILPLLLLLADPATLPPPAWDDRDAAPSLGTQRLRWPAGAKLSVREVDGEIVARANQPLDPATIAALRTAVPEAIEDLRWNDRNLVLRPAAGWRIAWATERTTLSLTFLKVADAGGTRAPADEAALDAARAAIEADAAAGYPGRARRAAERLAQDHPGDPAVQRTLADARNGDGDLRGAAELYRAAGATDVAARRARAFAPGSVAVTATARDGGDLTQVDAGARADVSLDRTTSVGVGIRHIESRIDTAAGRVAARSQVADATIGVRLGGDVRAALVAASALDTGVTGGGLRLFIGSSDLQLRGSALYRLPDYSTGQQALAAGDLTRLSLGGSYRVTPGLYAQLDGAWNRYGLDGARSASDTVTVAAGLDYLFRRGSPSLTLAYRLDAEYVLANRSPALTLIDRENHSVLGIASAGLGDVQLTGQLGYTVDRFGGDGPNAALGLSTAIGDGWRIEGSGGLTSVSRTGFDGRQLFGRAQITRGLGSGR